MCKLPYVCLDQNPFRVIQTRHKHAPSSLMTDSVCSGGVIFSVIDRHEVHKQMGEHLGSPREPCTASISPTVNCLMYSLSKTFKHRSLVWNLSHFPQTVAGAEASIETEHFTFVLCSFYPCDFCPDDQTLTCLSQLLARWALFPDLSLI